MNKLVTLFALVFMASATGLAQWNFAGYFPDSIFTKKNSGIHGIAVDPDGKVWAQWFGNTDSLADPGAGGTMFPTRAIYVFNPNGTQASFSPLKVMRGAGVNDTLWGAPSARALSNRGLTADNNGNIIASVFDRLYRINYQTGECMGKVIPQLNGTLTAAAVNNLGEIFVAKVISGAGPLQIFASNLSSLGNVTDTTLGFSRTVQVSADGNDVYFPGYTTHRILRYHSDFGSFGPYTVGPNDTLFKGFDCESMGWSPAGGGRPRLLWASSGSANDRPNRYEGAITNWTLNTWYAWNPTTNAIVDSLKWAWNGYLDSANVRPRAIAFSPDGNTAYVGCFGSSSIPTLQKFTRGPSSVTPDGGAIPVDFALSQNYPNPFNPSTEIKFNLNKAGFTTLKVYNTLGEEIATLVDGNLDAGAYTARFNVPNLASGTYIYRLTSNGISISKKMVLMK